MRKITDSDSFRNVVIKTLNTFSDQHLHTTTQMDLMYGDHLFNN